MRKTKLRERNNANVITVDIDGLAALLSCGESTARQIGKDAEARINIGRRVLYSVDKVKAYVNKVAC